VWAAALAALADSAARPPSRLSASQTGLGAPAAVAAGLCAVVVLAVDVGPGTSSLTHWPAVLTMVLSLGLLLSSLRDARSAAEAQRLSRTDDLTGLGNRRAVLHRLAASATSPSTLILLDLNGFKAVNDAFGHPEGDRLLVRVGQRLRDAVPAADLVARLGGDEFAVICHGSGRDEVTGKVESILAAMREPLAVADLGLTVSVAIGIAASSPHRHDASDLLRRADVAMYRAESAGGGYRWYDPRADEFSSERLHLIEELRAGIGAGQLRAFFQPQIDAANGTLVAVEALVRWQHPKRGLLAPAEFLCQARVAGLMLPLSLEMMRLCVGQAAVWAEAGCPLRVSLNVDPPELLSGAWGPALIAEIRRAGLDPALFTVELTEELLVSDPDRAAERIQELAAHGIEVSIDDYGTGYSGLAWLQTLPVRELKLAQPFVSQVLTDERTRTIVESTVRLATQLHLRVVAEGVEDPATAVAMTEMDVALLQGYLICRPLLADNLDAWRMTREQPALTNVPTVPAPLAPRTLARPAASDRPASDGAKSR
jgi:diguanylate cyclase (GGDEF)-like protein